MYEQMIFVFGSNLKGIHGSGSAKEAWLRWGAKLGRGVGLTGNAYAIPTKATPKAGDRLLLPSIAHHVTQFVAFAAERPTWQFQVVPIGCGAAGYTPAEIAPLFRGATDNVVLPAGWRGIIELTTEEAP